MISVVFGRSRGVSTLCTGAAGEVVRLLGLTKTLDTKVGDGVRTQGVSGGERKRVGIASAGADVCT